MSQRKPRRPDVVVFRVRVSLNRSEPEIWRTLDVRSDINLDRLHEAIQEAFGWWDYHLYRFTLGGEAFEKGRQQFLCPWDVEHEGEWCDDEEQGEPAAETRLDEVLAEPGDTIAYIYDFGDHWDCTSTLVEVLSAPTDSEAPTAVCVAGARAAPPEDCGSLRTAEELAEVLDDPAAFDVSDANARLNTRRFQAVDQGISECFVSILRPLSFQMPDVVDTAVFRGLSILDDDEALANALDPFLWLMDQALEGGIPLTPLAISNPPASRHWRPGCGPWIFLGVRQTERIRLGPFGFSVK